MSLRQSSTDSARQRSSEADRRSLCWRPRREQPCLCVETGTDESFIFPYQQFLGARHTRQAETETLTISFSTHEITVSGRQLGALASALQDLSIDWIKAVPARYRELQGNEGVVITQIDVNVVEVA